MHLDLQDDFIRVYRWAVRVRMRLDGEDNRNTSLLVERRAILAIGDDPRHLPFKRDGDNAAIQKTQVVQRQLFVPHLIPFGLCRYAPFLVKYSS